MVRWLDRNTQGDLIFDESPYVVYRVRPSEKPEIEIYKRENCTGAGETYSGMVVIHFKAYTPSGTLSILTEEEAIAEKERTRAQTGVVASSLMPYTPGSTISAGMQLIYNPGTQITPATILFKGNGNNITVSNAATGETLKITNLPSGVTAECEIAYDAEHASTRKYYGGANNEFCYLYHDGDYIHMAPGNLTRNVVVSTQMGSRTVTSNGAFTKTMEGQYIYINGGWH